MWILSNAWNRSATRGAAIGVVCGLACWLVSLHPVLRGLEEWCQDACFVYRGVRPSASRDHIVIVSLDDASVAELSKPLAFASPELAEVVDYLSGRQAAAIGLDVMVPEELDRFPGLGGEDLGLAAAQAGRVVLPVASAGTRLIRPLRVWRTGSPLALVDLVEDDDHFLRRQRLATRVAGADYYQFGVALLKAAGRVDDTQPDGRLRVDGRIVPTDPGGLVRINFVGPTGTFTQVPMREILAAARGGPPPAIELEGAVVVIGATARSLGDYHVTPYANGTLRGLWSRIPGLMSGPEFHANVIATLGDGATLTTPPWLQPLPLVLLGGGLLGAVFTRLSLSRGALLAAGHHVGWKAAGLAGLSLGPWRVEMVAMLLTGATCYAATFMLRWRILRRMFGVFKSESVARALEDNPGRLHRPSEERELTVLFADLRNFSTFSEALRPGQIVDLLNAYYGAVVPVLERHGGTLNQYMGDGVMVLFGALETAPDHAARGVRAAIAMVERVHELAPLWAAKGYPGLRIGVGVHTGPAVVGIVGSPGRLDFTAIGDTINTAARIEAENKPLGTEVLISEATHRALPPGERARLGFAAQGEARTIKGRTGPVVVYRLAVPDGLEPRPSEDGAGRSGPDLAHERRGREPSGI